MYKGWLKQTNPRAGARKQAMFSDDLARWVAAHPTSKQWVFQPEKRVRQSQVENALKDENGRYLYWDETICEFCEDLHDYITTHSSATGDLSRMHNLLPLQPTGILSSEVIAEKRGTRLITTTKKE